MSAVPGQLTDERRSFRAPGDPYQGYQEKRRRDALSRQKAARLHSAKRARTLALEQEDEDGEKEARSGEQDSSGGMDDSINGASKGDAGMEPSTSYDTAASGPRGKGKGGPSGRRQQQRQRRKQVEAGGVRAYGLQYGNELMQPEWMTDVPIDLATNWMVMPRPEGMRCLLVTSRGRTVSWLRNGAPLHRFHSHLPGGSPGTAGGGGTAAAQAAAGDYCILDCIFHPPNNTYYIQDLLCWRGYALYDCAAEFRAFWLAGKLREEGLLEQPTPPASVPGMPTDGSRNAAVGTTAAPLAVLQPQPRRQLHQQQQQRAGSGGPKQEDVDMAGNGDGSQQQDAPLSYRIVPLPVWPCTLAGLRAAYGSGETLGDAVSVAAAAASAASGPAPTGGNDPWVTCLPPSTTASSDASSLPTMVAGGEHAGDVAFLRDGLYFLHRQGHYSPGPGTTPLALLWKDLGCSRYLIDTDAKGLPLEHQLVVLSYRADRTVATEDEPPVVLGRLPEAFVAAMGNKLGAGRLLRFSMRQGGITFHEGRPVGADLHYEGPANQRRGRADSFSKILFQRLARTAPITVAALVAAAAVGAGGPAGPGAGIGAGSGEGVGDVAMG